MQQMITDDLEALLVTLPPEIHDAVNRLDNRSELLEIVMDLGRLPEGRFPEGEVILSTQPVTYAELEYVVERIGEFGDDNRADTMECSFDTSTVVVTKFTYSLDHIFEVSIGHWLST